MALGHGSKKSVSCDQEVPPASLNNGVSSLFCIHALSILEGICDKIC